MAWPRPALLGARAEWWRCGPPSSPASRWGAVSAPGGPLSMISIKARDEAAQAKKYFFLLLLVVVISRGTGWKWTYAAGEIVAFSDVCWSRSLSRLFLTMKGQRKQEYTEREIPFPWLPVDCLPRWEAGLLPLYFIPWWCILDNWKTTLSR